MSVLPFKKRGKRRQPGMTVGTGFQRPAMSPEWRNTSTGPFLAQKSKAELRARRRAGMETARYQRVRVKAARRQWAANRRAM